MDYLISKLRGAEAVRRVGKPEINRAVDTLKKYKQGKSNFENRVVANEQYYKLRHWDLINRVKDPNRIEPSSAWLFNSIANKHADAMDHYPEPIILPREPGDERDADALSKIMPVILERNDFEKTYSDAWWAKLKHGVCAYGVFWNKNLENSIGDISICPINILNLFWEPGIVDIQASRNLFVVSLMENDLLCEQYPELKNKPGGGAIDIKSYIHDDNVDVTEKAVVVDWYYKRNVNGRNVLHYCKFVNDEVLYASENIPELRDKGFYEHGEYPIVFDVLFPMEGSPAGFGYVDIMRDTQIYIDKLNQIVIENAMMSGRKRFFIKDSGGVNEEEFADWSKTFVHVAGGLNEDNIREIDIKPLDGYIVNHLEHKINELKETSGNRDFSQGGTSGGVTAAAAIAALQEAGSKLSRDMIKGSYRAFCKVNHLCIELVRQFYDESRFFRVEGVGYISFKNETLKENPLRGGRVPIFDIRVKAQRANPFSRASQNELALRLYSVGFFDSQRAEQSLAALELMDFEGKPGVVERVQRDTRNNTIPPGMLPGMAKGRGMYD